MRKAFIGGNWKSNGDVKFIQSHVKNVINTLTFNTAQCEVIIAPTTLHLDYTRSLLDKNSNVKLASQNVSAFPEGAYTGEVTAKQLKDFNIEWTLIGHSERRQYFNESDEIVGKKTKITLDNGVNVITCIGERLEERESNRTMEVCLRQMDAIAKNTSDWNKIVIAYEPVWAIGTGKTASKEQAQDVHGELRNWISSKVGKDIAEKVRIIYGGSVTEANAGELITQKDIDGFLVGGASLKPGFKTIVDAYAQKFKKI
jgi:triosephosphate isomerase (TIM)